MFMPAFVFVSFGPPPSGDGRGVHAAVVGEPAWSRKYPPGARSTDGRTKTEEPKLPVAEPYWMDLPPSGTGAVPLLWISTASLQNGVASVVAPPPPYTWSIT